LLLEGNADIKSKRLGCVAPQEPETEAGQADKEVPQTLCSTKGLEKLCLSRRKYFL
jgi:hypothetical protein